MTKQRAAPISFAANALSRKLKIILMTIVVLIGTTVAAAAQLQPAGALSIPDQPATPPSPSVGPPEPLPFGHSRPPMSWPSPPAIRAWPRSGKPTSGLPRGSRRAAG